MGILWDLLYFVWSASIYGSDAKCLLELRDGMVDKATIAFEVNVSKDSIR